MTESSPQPGDNETHDATTGPKPSTESAPDQADSATRASAPNHAQVPPAAGGVTGDKSKDTLEQSSEDDDDGSSDEDGSVDDEEEHESSDDDDEDEDEEPKLKYARLTPHLGPVYRNGDATSASLVAGDKMVRMTLSPSRPSYRSG
jgi:hypothetical protein